MNDAELSTLSTLSTLDDEVVDIVDTVYTPHSEAHAYFTGNRTDRRWFAKIPFNAITILKNGSDWRVLAAICATASPLGICYASQGYIGALAGGIDQSDVSRSLKRLHQLYLVRLLLPKGKPYPGRLQRCNRMQVLFNGKQTPMPSHKEIMLQWGSRVNRW